MKFLLFSLLWLVLNLSYVSVTGSNQKADDGSDLTDLIRTYLDARQLYQLLQVNNKVSDADEIDVVDREISRLTQQNDEDDKRRKLNRLRKTFAEKSIVIDNIVKIQTDGSVYSTREHNLARRAVDRFAAAARSWDLGDEYDPGARATHTTPTTTTTSTPPYSTSTTTTTTAATTTTTTKKPTINLANLSRLIARLGRRTGFWHGKR